MSGANVIEVDEADFRERVVEASRQAPVVVDFWAGWCQPCLVLGPVLERLAAEYEGRFTLAKVDVDRNQALAGAFRVQGIPAVKAFVDGGVAAEFVGVQPEQTIRAFLDSLMPTAADDLVEAAARASSPAEAEELYREALEADPGHVEAAAGLAGVLFRLGATEEAEEVLARVPESGDVRRLRGEIELRRAADQDDGPLSEAAAAALDGRHREALEAALASLRLGEADAARDLMVRLFDVLGPDDPLTGEYRRRLANTLF